MPDRTYVRGTPIKHMGSRSPTVSSDVWPHLPLGPLKGAMGELEEERLYTTLVCRSAFLLHYAPKDTNNNCSKGNNSCANVDSSCSISTSNFRSTLVQYTYGVFERARTERVPARGAAGLRSVSHPSSSLILSAEADKSWVEQCITVSRACSTTSWTSEIAMSTRSILTWNQILMHALSLRARQTTLFSSMTLAPAEVLNLTTRAPPAPSSSAAVAPANDSHLTSRQGSGISSLLGHWRQHEADLRPHRHR